MLKKSYNSIQDFLEDDSFKNWAHESQLSDVSFWNLWVKNNRDKKHLAYEARDILLGINFKKQTVVSEEKLDTEWEKLLLKIETPPKHNAKKNTKKKKFTSLIGIAASLLILIGTAFFLYNNFATITHKTSFGETLELKLNDGTLVILNSNSSLHYKKNETRKVQLEGEAYFAVHKKESENAKFWVNTNDIVIEVFGTKFNVNTFQHKTSVYLEEGNIWLSLNNGESKKMNPGNYIEYSSEAQKIIIDKKLGSKNEQTAWTNGKLIFDNYTLEKALEKISNSYGVTFHYKNSAIKNTLISGIVPTTNLNICLNAIKKSAGVTIKKENNTFVIEKNK